jgi:uncharacterized membrane protein YbhN (UPF0104 family)
MVFRYWGVLVWRTILRCLGETKLPSPFIMSSIYSKAWMARYIPGTVGWYTGKIFMTAKYGISKSRLAASSFLEGGMQVVAVTFVSFLLIGFDPQLKKVPLDVKLLLIIASFGMLFLLFPPIFNRLIRFAFVKFRKKDPGDELRINHKAALSSFLLYAVGAVISGSSSFILAKAIEPSTPWHLYIYLTGSFSLAAALGMASPLPGGIGVRDAAQLLLLSVVFPRDIALIITLTNRLWSVSVDVIFLFIAVSLNRLRDRLKRAEQPES